MDDNAGLEAGHSTQDSASEDNMLVGQETYVVDNGVDNIESWIDMDLGVEEDDTSTFTYLCLWNAS
jgi:hypothetical protein